MTTSPTPCRCGPEGCADSSCPGRRTLSPADALDAMRHQLDPVDDWREPLELAAAELRRLAAVERELETERIRLAACSVIANANTPESAASGRQMLPKYWSASAADVAAAVDREMALRADRDRLAAEVEALRAALTDVLALPLAQEELHYLRRGIGTATKNAAWLRAAAAIDAAKKEGK